MKYNPAGTVQPVQLPAEKHIFTLLFEELRLFPPLTAIMCSVI